MHSSEWKRCPNTENKSKTSLAQPGVASPLQSCCLSFALRDLSEDRLVVSFTSVTPDPARGALPHTHSGIATSASQQQDLVSRPCTYGVARGLFCHLGAPVASGTFWALFSALSHSAPLRNGDAARSSLAETHWILVSYTWQKHTTNAALGTERAPGDRVAFVS